MDRKKRNEKKVEIAGVEVSQALIESAVRATSDPSKVQQIEEREQARVHKTLLDHELRKDLDVSKQVVKALLDQVGKPEPQRIDIESLPPFLKRTVIAYVNMCEAREEYMEAVKGLAASASVDSMPEEVVTACKAINVDPERLVAGLHCIDPRDV